MPDQAGVRIRPYLEADEAEVVALWKGNSPTYSPWNEPHASIRRKLAVQRDLFLVGEREGRIVGTVMAGYDGHRGWIYSLAVTPEHRRCGIARLLMGEAEQRLRALGCPKINLQVLSSNAEVISLYEKLGYAVEERFSLGKPLV